MLADLGREETLDAVLEQFETRAEPDLPPILRLRAALLRAEAHVRRNERALLSESMECAEAWLSEAGAAGEAFRDRFDALRAAARF